MLTFVSIFEQLVMYNVYVLCFFSCMYWCVQEELTLAGYRRHQDTANAPPPLTREEMELKQMKDEEVCFAECDVKLAV